MVETVEKLPPHNMEAEQSVLGSLLIDRDAVIRIASFLKPSDFYSSGNGLIYEAILDLYNRRIPPDFVTIVDELTRRERLQDVGGITYLTELINAVPTAVHIEFYGHIVERTATLRRLIDAGATIVSIGYDDSIEVEDALDRSERAIFDVSQRRTVRDFVGIGEVLETYFDKLDTIQQHRGEVVGVPTGYADLDKLNGRAAALRPDHPGGAPIRGQNVVAARHGPQRGRSRGKDRRHLQPGNVRRATCPAALVDGDRS